MVLFSPPATQSEATATFRFLQGEKVPLQINWTKVSQAPELN